MSAYIQLGKHGDILSLLPILHDEFVRTGKKPILVVSEPYKAIPERLDYIRCEVFKGDVQDLKGAIKFAKKNWDDVVVCQTHGRGFDFEHRHPSFQLDQWDRAGMLHKWDSLPLILPRPKKSPIEIPSGRFIIYADHSQSSPFLQKDDLADALKKEIASHKIIRMSEVMVKNPLDLLPLMDAADMIVSTDTMHLHLSKACSVPVGALVSDGISRWHGSAWSKGFEFHCRYSDYSRRKGEIIRKCQEAVSKKVKPQAMPFQSSLPNAYNLGMLWHGEVLVTSSRYHPIKKDWRTRLSIHDGVTSSDIVFPTQFDGHSQEDARLFHHNGKLMISYVLATAVAGQLRCVVGYGMLVQRENRWHVDKHHQPAFRDNDFSGMVKNLVPFEHDGKIHFIWGNIAGEQVIIEVDGDKVVREIKSPDPKWDYGEIRGGVIVRHKDKLLRFFHSRTGSGLSGKHGEFQYHIGASLMESTPPFKTVAVSSHPILSGDERYVPGCSHWKPNVVIVYGAVNRGRQGGEVIQISIGRNDSGCEVVPLKESDLNL